MHGCFWHVHVGCEISHMPESELWQKKLEKNQNRDLAALAKLQASGWQIITIWECELKDPAVVTNRLLIFLS